MVTDENITRKQFVFWQKVLTSADVSVDFWDTTRYNGFSVDATTNQRHPVSWEGRYSGKMILYPYCNLDLLWGIDIVRHFHGNNHREGALQELNSSMVLLLPPSQPHTQQQDRYSDKGDRDVIKHLSAVDGPIALPENTTYSGFHLTRPGGGTPAMCSVIPSFIADPIVKHMTSDRPYLSWEKKQLKKLEKEVPSQSATVLTRTTDINPTSLFRYNYGQVDMRRIPLLRSSKLLVMDGAGGSALSMSNDDFHLGPNSNQIPLASNFGQIILAVLFGLPMKCKMGLLKKSGNSKEEADDIEVTFTTPNGVSYSRPELVMICAASEIADDLLSCSGTARRMSEFASEIEDNSTDYTPNGATILRGMTLVVEEGKRRKKQLKTEEVNRALQELIRLASTVERALQSVGGVQQQPPLVSFDHLMDAAHKTSQHRVKDGRWNIPG